ncbi:MAG: flagellar motor switch protein FliN [Betaproteobacteria bacterium]|nr:flagellar motor switch protein FliN [Betaproteobacteria bacterium]
MSEEVALLTEEDRMAAEWAAALDESRPEPTRSDAGSGTAPGFAAGANGVNGADSVAAASFTNFTASTPGGGVAGNDLNMILDIPVQLTVELGRTRIPIKHILQLAQGSVVELDALAGEPMDVLVNGYLIAQGEVVVVNDKFGIRLTDIVTPGERMRRLSRT